MRFSEQSNILHSLLRIAQIKGEFLRFPDRFNENPNIDEFVCFQCNRLDELNVSWSVQNQILNIINNVDTAKYWEFLYKNDFQSIAVKALKGERLI